MSQISLKSISGITSITTPAGVDNQLTLHTNNTTQALKLDSAGNLHFNNHVNTTGISSASNFKTGSSNLHSTGLSAASIDVGSNIKLGNAGVVTATTFKGNGDFVELDVDGTAELDHTNITGIATFMDAINVADIIRHGGDPDTYVRFPSNDTITLGTAGGERIRITSDGKIGMKTTSPQKDLHVYNSSVATVRIETGDSRGQAWDILSTNGAQNNTGTISIRDESGSSYIDFGANGGDPRLVAQLGGGSNLLYLDKHGNTNLAGICTATAFRGQIYPTIYAGGRRNMFINGEFSVIQRGNRDPHANQNNGANNLGYGGPDHVQVVKNIGSYDAKQVNENSSPRTQAGASYSYELDVTATGSTSNTGYCFLNWMWNGHEVNRLLYGTSSARPITVSFWCQSNLTGTFGLNMRNYGTDRMISQALTINSANTWEYKTVTFAGDTAAQFSVTINATMAIELWLAAGTDYNSGTPQSTWASRNNTRRSAGTNINIASNTSNYFRISLLQVEMGPYATPFEFRTYGEYLHDCEYYFQKPVSSRGSNYPFAIHTWGHKVADTYALRVQTMMRPTEMRINPTDYFHDNNPSGLTAQRFTIQGADYEYTYGVNMSIGSNRKEFANGNKYPYGVNGMGAGESGILWAYDFESYAEY